MIQFHENWHRTYFVQRDNFYWKDHCTLGKCISLTVKVIDEEAEAHHEKGGSGQDQDQHRVVGRVKRSELSSHQWWRDSWEVSSLWKAFSQFSEGWYCQPDRIAITGEPNQWGSSQKRLTEVARPASMWRALLCGLGPWNKKQRETCATSSICQCLTGYVLKLHLPWLYLYMGVCPQLWLRYALSPLSHLCQALCHSEEKCN